MVSLVKDKIYKNTVFLVVPEIGESNSYHHI